MTHAKATEYKYVVLGGGNSAGYVADEFAKRGLDGSLAILGDEALTSYERPTISKAFLFPSDPARVPGFNTTVGGGGKTHDEAWYKENGIDFHTNTKVVGVDVKGKKVKIDGGAEISYEKLIIALGSVAIDMVKAEGGKLDNIFYLRNTVDGDALLKGIKSAKAAGNKAVVVGAGYIGLEVGAALAKNGLQVDLVLPSDKFMPRLFTKEIAAFYEKIYAESGINIIKKEYVTGFEGDGKVERAVLKSGKKIECDLVVVGIGARPNIDLFKGQVELLEDKPGGIKVDSHLQTSEAGVYAIGDVAAFPLKQYGNKISRQEHVAHARQSAKYVVAQILEGGAEEYVYDPVFFYSRVPVGPGLSWQFYGDNSDADETIFFGSTNLKAPKFGTYFIKAGKIIGVFLESGSDKENAAVRKVAQQRPAVPTDLQDQGLDFALNL